MSNELTGQKAAPVSGVLGTKLGMTQVWDENGKLVPVTVVQTGANVVTQIRSVETDDDAVQIAYGQIDPRKVSQPLKGHFEKAGVTPRRHLVELRTLNAAEYSLSARRLTRRSSRPARRSTSSAPPRARAPRAS